MKNDKKDSKNMTEEKEIMDRILVGKDGSLDEMARGLDFLIYRRQSDMDEQDREPADALVGEEFRISKGSVSVEVWNGKARITVKVPPGSRPDLSLKKIATLAVDAINEALTKERL